LSQVAHEPLDIVNPVALFPGERLALVALLHELDPEQWFLPTACEGWSVHDIALHLFGGDVNILSGGRDGFRGPPDQAAPEHLDEWSNLVQFINQRNAEWITALRRTSPRLVTELLETLNQPTAQHFASANLMAPGPTVNWMGRGPHPYWIHIAREYTERWVHQQQIRDAVQRPGLTERTWMYPVLDMFARALPHALRDQEAQEGTGVMLTIDGDAGGHWVALRASGGWVLSVEVPATIAASVRLPDGMAWRLFTKGISAAEIRDEVDAQGDAVLTDAVLAMVSVIA
jgi:uncharacterized protein (TIGR03083 family)